MELYTPGKPETVLPNEKTSSRFLEEATYITPGLGKSTRKTKKIIDEDEPLVDTTAALPLRSKRTERTRRRHQKKQKQAAERPLSLHLLDLPPELLQEILGHLAPSDLFHLLRLNRSIHNFILEHETSILRDVIRQRYWVLARSFPSPVALADVDSSAHASLLSEGRQRMTEIHRRYQHIRAIDPLEICTCSTCLFAWNNLCLILDLAHWQQNLNQREPIPMIPRGSSPEWNTTLVDTNAILVRRAMKSRLSYARILEKHLQTTVQTILRTFRGKKTLHPRRLYYLTPGDARKETDEFLERNGPASFEMPWLRDNYYNLEAYVPNRRWSVEQKKWLYYPVGSHEKDLQWVKEKFAPDPPLEKKTK